MNKLASLILVGLMITVSNPIRAEVQIDGFLQGLFGGSLDNSNPTETEQTASETRLQLRAEDFGDNTEFFGRLDFVYDGTLVEQYDWELREGYLKFKMGSNFDFKVGRQILTWGTGDLVFINDVFAKDYRSFFIGRDDQYLKAPQNALRAEYYNPLGSISVVWTPRFEPNRLPTGRRLSYYSPMAGGIVGTDLGEEYYFEAPIPESNFRNGELATRYQRRLGNFTGALYFYRGFYKNPVGFDPLAMVALYPRLNVYGASMRGAIWGGVLWLEGGYFDSRDDQCGEKPFIPNSSITGMVGFERQIASNLTVNAQWQADYIVDYDKFKTGFQMTNLPGTYIRDEVRHLLTSRVTQKLSSETVTVSAFAFYSPTDEDIYLRFSTEYKYSDEVTLTAGGNIFDGTHVNTEFGQFALNDNVFVKMTYGF